MRINPYPLIRVALCAAVVTGASVAWAGPDEVAMPAMPSRDGPVSAQPAQAILSAPTTPAPMELTQRMQATATGVVETAMNFLGLPYRRGGTTEAGGFDCSGFTRYMFEMSVGLVLPRRADEQAKAPGLTPVKRDELEPGDLVFFNTLRRTFSHVGIYVGDGKFIHAPKPGAEVRVEDMRFKYWAKRFTGARRADRDIDPMTPNPPPSVRKAAAER
jgi:cell wall-associated NlpC family hydrolase